MSSSCRNLTLRTELGMEASGSEFGGGSELGAQGPELWGSGFGVSKKYAVEATTGRSEV